VVEGGEGLRLRLEELSGLQRPLEIEALLRAAALDALTSVETGLKGLPLKRGAPLETLERVAEVLVPWGAKFREF
jgi:hypothetical protein